MWSFGREGQRLPVVKADVVATLLGRGQDRAGRIVGRMLDDDGVLDANDVDALGLRVHCELQLGRRVAALVQTLITGLGLNIADPIRVVDVGYGIGHVLRSIAHRGDLPPEVELLGVDMNPVLIAEAIRLALVERLACRFATGDALRTRGSPSTTGHARSWCPPGYSTTSIPSTSRRSSPPRRASMVPRSRIGTSPRPSGRQRSRDRVPDRCRAIRGHRDNSARRVRRTRLEAEVPRLRAHTRTLHPHPTLRLHRGRGRGNPAHLNPKHRNHSSPGGRRRTPSRTDLQPALHPRSPNVTVTPQPRRGPLSLRAGRIGQTTIRAVVYMHHSAALRLGETTGSDDVGAHWS
jgi:hypothetical protein